MKIPLIKPYMSERIRQRVLDVLDSGYLTEGPVAREFESAIAEYVGCRNVLAVSSCTTGLELALRALGVGPGDEVIVPDYTYPATASVVNIVGATAVLVDVAPDSMLIDYDACEAAITAKTKAILPVSLFGNPLDYDRLGAMKEAHGIHVVEDGACALGAEYRGKRVGSLADITVFSFHPRKFITTGEGGAVTTDNDEWASWMRSYKRFGVGTNAARKDVAFDMVGTNYKLSDVLAAIGLEQMEMINDLLAERVSLAKRYDSLIKGHPIVRLPQTTEGGVHSYQTYCVFLPQREIAFDSLREAGIEVQIGTYSLHMHKAFSENALIRMVAPFSSSKRVFAECLALPMYHGMTEDEQALVVESLFASIEGN